ncbi:Pectinesterase [Ascochyta rabiei]|uniref:Pectinesterase n=1 Tax=Didymella rabiei TaxID=5454 RepID=A0A163LY48_DIDRA|nr:Pectinesterase [Ascochyta rabiei]KZM28226.1 aspartyl esterase [Ascochyta rabiei]UPX20851.1 Pectinesterase [Ascochyta rabiei]
MLQPLTLVLSLAAAAVAVPTSLTVRAGRTSPPAGCLTVGGSGTYKTVSDAVAKLSVSGTTAQCIFIYKGTYQEQVYVPPLESALAIYGETTDTSSFASNTVTITQGKSQDDTPKNDLTATLRAWSPNMKVYNINLVNTRGKGSQALAISANADKQGYYGCQFTGYQDTILAQTGNQIYAKCQITGSTDFIFGQKATAWFDGADIRVLNASVGYVTANGRDSDSNPSYYVFNKSKVSAAAGTVVKAGVYYLGRPWRNYSRVVFQKTNLSNVINPKGWAQWSVNDTRTDKVTYAEYHNTGAGATGPRASFGTNLSSAVSISTVLGSSYKSWVDTTYLS